MQNICKCSGNKGYYEASMETHVLKKGGVGIYHAYKHDKDYGNHCAKFDEDSYDKDGGEADQAWKLESW